MHIVISSSAIQFIGNGVSSKKIFNLLIILICDIRLDLLATKKDAKPQTVKLFATLGFQSGHKLTKIA